MLHRRFKSAKCKTSLKLAVSRIKLLKNKKMVQITQLKRELAQLIQSGQHQTARIRVEHVMREEKMMEAYDLIEIYCEHIAARLPTIDSQKNCPIDLKEAIASVIFATPRCGEISELADIRKQMAAKYGKEFISSATELRPNCGVGRMLVEKLSTVAPDGQTKMKVLNRIAEEHNIKWDPASFSEGDPKLNEDSSNAESSFSQATENHAKKQNSMADLDNGYDRSSKAGISQKDSGSDSYFRDAKQVASDRNVESQSWNMEFKDATAAAQAAAESAERASMAARAAAHLSARDKLSRNRSSMDSDQYMGFHKHPSMDSHPERQYMGSYAGDTKESSGSPSTARIGAISDDALRTRAETETGNVNTPQSGISRDDYDQYVEENDITNDTKHHGDAVFDDSLSETSEASEHLGRHDSGRDDSALDDAGDEYRRESPHSSSHERNSDIPDLHFEGQSSVIFDDSEASNSENEELKYFHDSEPQPESFRLDSPVELKLGNLTGGLRNKGYKYLPYRDDAKITDLPSTSDSVVIKETDASSSPTSNRDGAFEATTGFSYSSDDSDNALQSMNTTQGSHNQTTDTDVLKKSRHKSSIMYFDSDSEDLPNQTPIKNKDRHSAFSRRTKASSSKSSSDYTVRTVDAGIGSKSEASSHATNSKEPSEEVQLSSKIETLLTASDERLSTEKRRASHVHPKLPDYDTLFNSFNLNRR